MIPTGLLVNIQDKDYLCWIHYTNSHRFICRIEYGYLIFSVPEVFRDKRYSKDMINFIKEISYETVTKETHTIVSGLIPSKKDAPGYIYLLGNKYNFYFADVKRTIFDGDTFLFSSWGVLENKLKSEIRPYILQLIAENCAKLGVNVDIDLKFTSAASFSGCLSYRFKNKEVLTMKINRFVGHFHPSVINGLIAHEVCHVLYKNHKQEFFDAVYKICPNYDENMQCLHYGYFGGLNENNRKQK